MNVSAYPIRDSRAARQHCDADSAALDREYRDTLVQAAVLGVSFDAYYELGPEAIEHEWTEAMAAAVQREADAAKSLTKPVTMPVTKPVPADWFSRDYGEPKRTADPWLIPWLRWFIEATKPEAQSSWQAPIVQVQALPVEADPMTKIQITNVEKGTVTVRINDSETRVLTAGGVLLLGN